MTTAESILPPAPARTTSWPSETVPRDRLPVHVGKRIMRDPFGCWIMFGYCDKDGYACIKKTGTRVPQRGHRLVYELLIGEIPDGLALDHLCRVPNCVNPAHIEPVTNRENARRGRNGVLKTHCAFGHPYTEENVRQIKTGPRAGKRYCGACHRERWGSHASN